MIDLMVILDNNHVSKTYEERLNKKIFIRNLILEINRKVPLDILVYSKEELALIKKHGNYFIDEIEKTGKIIYEKAKRMNTSHRGHKEHGAHGENKNLNSLRVLRSSVSPV